jgi:hypothetical protein
MPAQGLIYDYSVGDLLQELHSRILLEIPVHEIEETVIRNAGATGWYRVRGGNLNSVERIAASVVRGEPVDITVDQHDAEIQINLKLNRAKMSARSAESRQAAEVIPLDTVPITCYCQDNIYSLGSDGKDFFVIKNGDNVQTCGSYPEALAAMHKFMYDALVSILEAKESGDPAELYSQYLEGVVPILLESAEGTAADHLIKFFETSTLHEFPT